MIIDSHAYCFQPGNHPAGFPNAAEHLAWIQTSQGLHHQPAWNIKDRTPAPSDGLGDEAPLDWSQLPDVDFRIDDQLGRAFVLGHGVAGELDVVEDLVVGNLRERRGELGV